MRAQSVGGAAGMGAGTLAFIIATACLLLANLYYPQPILHEAAADLGLAQDAVGTLITAGQLGYIAGLLLVAPLGDMLDNRRLCAAMTAGAGAAALAASQAGSAPLFLALMLLMGVCATATQVLVVFATALAGPGRSGKILGIMACGLFLGIALSRPAASLVSGVAGWRAVYLGSGLALLGMGLCLALALPERPRARGRAGYGAMLRSMARLLRFPLLLRRAALSCGAFFSFSMFWSALPLALAAQPQTQGGITRFTFAGLVTPPSMLLVGKLLDRGRGRQILLTALGLGILAWGMPLMGPAWAGIFVASTLLLDPSSNAVTVSIQQRILADAPADARGRLNSLIISPNFLSGAAGAALGPWLLAHCGLGAVLLTGALLLGCLLGFAATSRWQE